MRPSEAPFDGKISEQKMRARAKLKEAIRYAACSVMLALLHIWGLCWLAIDGPDSWVRVAAIWTLIGTGILTAIWIMGTFSNMFDKADKYNAFLGD